MGLLIFQICTISTTYADSISDIQTMQDVVEKMPLIMAQTMRDSCKKEQPSLSTQLDSAYEKGSVQLSLASKNPNVEGRTLSDLPKYYEKIDMSMKLKLEQLISATSESVKNKNSLKICTAFINDLNQLDAKRLRNEAVEKYKQYEQRQLQQSSSERN